MADVLFYHLTESSLEEALPALLEKSLDRGWKAVVQAAGEERRDALDLALWTYRDESFLAHGTDREPFPEEQPVFLTVGNGNPNGSAIRFLVDGAVSASVEDYERIVFMFDGGDEAQVAAARDEWKKLKAGGNNVTYWQQTPERRWERKA
jgi:DNA polymerase-3 subunit chi